jgi:hypothetical protein
MGNPNVFEYPKGDFDFEVVLKSGDIGYTNPGYTFALLNDDMYDNDCIDRITTLSNHYEPAWVQQNDLEILNDSKIYNTSLKNLVKDYNLYDYIKREYGENSRG